MDNLDTLGSGYNSLRPFEYRGSLETTKDETFVRNMQSLNDRRSTKFRSVLLATIMASLVFAVVVTLAIVQDFSKPRPDTIQAIQTQKNCGTSPAEARDRQCVFDIVSRFWVPGDCFYPEIDREFRTRTKSPYFGDVNGTFIISREKLPEYIGKLFVRADYHRMHCAFLLRRNHLAVRNGGRLAARMTSFEHTEHCTDILLEETSDPDRIGSIFDLAYPDCVDAREALSIGGVNGHHSSIAPDLVPHKRE